jgi:HSF-type DNA-binding
MTDDEKVASAISINENGKRYRPEDDGEGDKREEQPCTSSCGEDPSSSSSLTSLQKVARLDGHPSQSEQAHHSSPGNSSPAIQVVAHAASSPRNSIGQAPHSVSATPMFHHVGMHVQALTGGTSHNTSTASVSIVPVGGGPTTVQNQPPHHNPISHSNTIITACSSATPPGGGGGGGSVQHQHQLHQRQTVNGSGGAEKMLRPFPYFYYRDFSHVPDPDPLSPLTAPGRVPNFPAKMHSILSRADLADIVSWNEHGRAWRVLKPREFEVKVIPTYFEVRLVVVLW